MNAKVYEKLASGLRRELTEIDRDIERTEQRLAELRVERRRVYNGLVGIKHEIKRAKESSE